MEFQIATGNPELDRQQLAQVEQQYAAQGYSVQATPLPTGGFHVKLVPAGAPGAAPSAAPGGYAPQQGAPGAAPGGYAPQQGAPGAAPNPYGAPQGAPGAAPNPYGAPQGAPGAAPNPYGAPQGAPGDPQAGYGGQPGAPGAPGGGFGGAPGAPAAGAFGQAAGSVAGGAMGGALGGALGGVLGKGTSSASSGGGFLRNWRVLHAAAVIIAAIAAAAMFVMPDMPVAVIAGIAAGLALVLSIVLLIVARPKILHSIGAIGLSVLLGAVGGGVMWFLTHPSVYVDNPTKDAIQIYVDGKPVLSLKSNTHDSVSVHKGKHTFGWSPKAEKKPTATVDAEVKFMKAHLYNPGKTGCYWLQVDVYGNVSDGGRAAGPQSIEEFYVFDSIDNWFTENPDYVKVKKKEKGKVKTALQQAKACMEFAHCALGVRVKLVECQKAAFKKDSEEAFQACGEEAERTCTSGGGGGSAPPAGTAAPKAGAKPAPKTR